MSHRGINRWTTYGVVGSIRSIRSIRSKDDFGLVKVVRIRRVSGVWLYRRQYCLSSCPILGYVCWFCKFVLVVFPILLVVVVNSS